ncbi:MAG: hypothetical protein Q7R47_01625, partial [Candidatus Diapherotrites archaeon]|nr:hypothetical protein [Candidatus Diapherotrites archaeon]
MDMENDGTVNQENKYHRAMGKKSIAGWSADRPHTFARFRKARGQLSIEFMLVVVVSIVYLNTVIFPQVAFGQTV